MFLGSKSIIRWAFKFVYPIYVVISKIFSLDFLFGPKIHLAPNRWASEYTFPGLFHTIFLFLYNLYDTNPLVVGSWSERQKIWQIGGYVFCRMSSRASALPPCIFSTSSLLFLECVECCSCCVFPFVSFLLI